MINDVGFIFLFCIRYPHWGIFPSSFKIPSCCWVVWLSPFMVIEMFDWFWQILYYTSDIHTGAYFPLLDEIMFRQQYIDGWSLLVVYLMTLTLDIYSHIYLSLFKNYIGLIVLLYLSIFYIYIVLLYSILYIARSLTYILFSFYYFSRKFHFSIDPLTKACTLKKGKQNIFGGKRSTWLYTYGRKWFFKGKREIF